MREIFEQSGVVTTTIIKTNKRKTPFELLIGLKTISRFDTEEKARLASDMFQAGASYYKHNGDK